MTKKIIKIISLILTFTQIKCDTDYNLILKLAPHSVTDEAYVTVSDKNKAVVNHKFISKNKPLDITLPHSGPYFITYLTSDEQTIDKHWSSGLGKINIPKDTKSATYELCVDDKKQQRCPQNSIILDPEWPNISLTGAKTIAPHEMTKVE